MAALKAQKLTPRPSMAMNAAAARKTRNPSVVTNRCDGGMALKNRLTGPRASRTLAHTTKRERGSRGGTPAP